jgi:hypothetical protein
VTVREFPAPAERAADGTLRCGTEYRLGILDGLSCGYWPDGEVRRETWYDYGVRLRERSWSASGRPQEDIVTDAAGLKHHCAYGEDGTVVQAYHRGPD